MRAAHFSLAYLRALILMCQCRWSQYDLSTGVGFSLPIPRLVGSVAWGHQNSSTSWCCGKTASCACWGCHLHQVAGG